MTTTAKLAATAAHTGPVRGVSLPTVAVGQGLTHTHNVAGVCGCLATIASNTEILQKHRRTVRNDARPLAAVGGSRET